MTSNNREEWLIRATKEMESYFNCKVPAFRVSVGFPGGSGKKGNTIGQAWKADCAEDKIPQVFISPVIADSIEVLATLLHEIVHVVDHNEHGHRKPFADLAKSVGLVKPWTATTPSEELVVQLKKVVHKLGDYPHSALNKVAGGSPHTQNTRMLKVECVNETGYKVRMSKKWLEEFGAPTCACCNQLMEVDGE